MIASTNTTARQSDCTSCDPLPDTFPLRTGEPGDRLGQSVDVLGDRAVFGAPRPGGIGYVEAAIRMDDSWTFRPTLQGEAAQADDQFGDAVSLAGDLLAVGAPQRQVGSIPSAGRVSVHAWIDNGWSLLTHLTQPDGAEFDAQFGDAVDAWANPDDTNHYRIIVGASNAAHSFGIRSGRAFIFESFDGGASWESVATLETDIQEYAMTDDDRFGEAVAIDGDLAVIGVPGYDPLAEGRQIGLAFLAQAGESGWTMLPADSSWDVTGDPDRELGASVAITGDCVIVGAPGDVIASDEVGGPSFRTGSVRVAHADVAGLVEMQRIIPNPVPTYEDAAFGATVAVSGEVLLVAAPSGSDTRPPQLQILGRTATGEFAPVRTIADAAGFGTGAAIGRSPGRFFDIAAGDPDAGTQNDGEGTIRSLQDPDCDEVDCDENGIPDACQGDLGTFEDCDEDGINDLCQIATDPSIDCDGNGLPDTCDLRAAEIVWIIDPSGSTGLKNTAICTSLIGAIANRLAEEGLFVRTTILYTRPNGEGFDCVAGNDNVADRYGETVPFREEANPAIGQLTDPESWAAATAIVAEGHPWQTRLRIVAPISDECPWQGGDTCDELDAASAEEAWMYLACRDVFAMPVQTPNTFGDPGQVLDLMTELADRTSGEAFSIGDIEDPDQIAAVVDAFVAAVGQRLLVHDLEPFVDWQNFGDGLLDLCQVQDDELGFEDCNRNGISDLAERILGSPAYRALEGPLPEDPAQWQSVEDADGDGRLDICQDLTCPADVDGDSEVGFTDILNVLSVWGPCDGCPADLDADGLVGFNDLLLVLSGWGSCFGQNPPACAILAVPAEAPPGSIFDCLQKAGWDPVRAAPCIEAMILTSQP